jgi:hypothetical protein
MLNDRYVYTVARYHAFRSNLEHAEYDEVMNVCFSYLFRLSKRWMQTLFSLYYICVVANDYAEKHSY